MQPGSRPCTNIRRNQTRPHISAASNIMATNTRAYFTIPFDERQQAKAAGAQWDSTVKKWYAPTQTIAKTLAASWPAWDVGDHLETRVYFTIPYDDKDLAKEYGGRWDNEERMWYACQKSVAENMKQKWTVATASAKGSTGSSTGSSTSDAPMVAGKRVYFTIPYDDKELAKEVGGRWDSEHRMWYACQEPVVAKMKQTWKVAKTQPPTPATTNPPRSPPTNPPRKPTSSSNIMAFR